MRRTLMILAFLAAIVALPFALRRREPPGAWRAGDPVLTVISPHNEAIRQEFGRAFSAWHQARHGRPVRVDWRTIGGTTEIIRYLGAEYTSAFRAWRLREGQSWPVNGGDLILDRRFDANRPPADPEALRDWERQRDVHTAFRAIDDAEAFGCRMDVFFGGGVYDHTVAARQGLTVPPWPADQPPAGVLEENGLSLIPEALGGEIWRGERFFGAALSTFGIVYNQDRLRDLGITEPPRRWSDLADPRYFRQLGVADPTKSGSIAKAFEMIIHEQCHSAVARAGFTADDIAAFEARLKNGVTPDALPPAYQAAIEAGWREGLFLVQRIGANARYFTDGAGKVPIDVSMGNAAAGLAIDFYGRYQAEVTTPPGQPPRMAYVTPAGGSSVSADPISLLRGAREPELARRFILFVLGEAGQRLWNYRVGAPGGPKQYALRRLPIRRDFYPMPGRPEWHGRFERHRRHTVDDLGAPDNDPFTLAEAFTYYPRWTAAHFGAHRYLVRAMCMDAGDELRAAWQHILAHGGPEAQPAAMAMLRALPDLPEPVTWASAPGLVRRHAPIDFMREWTSFYRRRYREARAAVVASGGANRGED